MFYSRSVTKSMILTRNSRNSVSKQASCKNRQKQPISRTLTAISTAYTYFRRQIASEESPPVLARCCNCRGWTCVGTPSRSYLQRLACSPSEDVIVVRAVTRLMKYHTYLGSEQQHGRRLWTAKNKNRLRSKSSISRGVNYTCDLRPHKSRLPVVLRGN